MLYRDEAASLQGCYSSREPFFEKHRERGIYLRITFAPLTTQCACLDIGIFHLIERNVSVKLA